MLFLPKKAFEVKTTHFTTIKRILESLIGIPLCGLLVGELMKNVTFGGGLGKVGGDGAGTSHLASGITST